MKTIKSATGTLLIFLSFLLSNCTKDMQADYSSTTKEIISQGKWSVDYFYAGHDKTSQFASYQFTFTGNGTVTGSDGTNNFTGNWTMIRDVNRNDVLSITINSQEPHLSELNDHWNVTDKSTLTVAMTDGSSSQLRFRKL